MDMAVDYNKSYGLHLDCVNLLFDFWLIEEPYELVSEKYDEKSAGI